MNDSTKMMNRVLAAVLVTSLLAFPLLAAEPESKAPRAEATTDATSWSSGEYEYDGAGNIKKIGDDVYRYDAHGRLKEATATTPATPLNRQVFTYDRYGNIETISTTTAAGTQVAGYAVNPDTNQLNAAACPAGTTTCRMGVYDDQGSGNQVGFLQDNEFQWDALGMMVELDSHRGDRHERYIYDANDERIVIVDKPAGGSETQRRYAIRGIDNKVTRELTFSVATNTWTLPKDYVHRGGTLIASFSGSTPTPDRHYHADHLGSTRLVTDATGKRLDVHTYWPFGQEAPGSDHGGERMKFTGHERDGSAATGGLELDYMHARYYDPSLGRFLSIDPVLDLKRSVAQPQSWNRYSYAINNPINRIDRDGRIDDAIGPSMMFDCQLNNCRPNWEEDKKVVGAGVLAASFFIPGPEELLVAAYLGRGTAAARGTLLLGETMARVDKGKEIIGNVLTFTQKSASFNKLLAKNMSWLQAQVKSGARILDIGLDSSRGGRGGLFYKAEVALLEKLGFKKQFKHFIEIDGKKTAVFEWVRVAQ